MTRPQLCSGQRYAVARRFGILCLLLAAARMLTAQYLSKFEPAVGCYIGAFIEKDSVARGDYLKFEQLTGKKHASYFTYVGYGMPFPTEWVANVKSAGAAPHLAFEPNNGLEVVQDGDYLRDWARAARAADCPVFLRFASEMNGNWTAYHNDPRLYRRKFQLVHDVMEREAPNVAMVWTPFATLNARVEQYYPGDEYVDWVGVNIYSVYVHDGDPRKLAYQEDPADFLRFIYDRYSRRKPIQISEFAAAHYHRSVDREVVDFAIEKMKKFYQALPRDFPRVKSINWFCMDTVDEKLADSNYSVLENERVRDTYQQLVADRYFLSRVAYVPLGPAPGSTAAASAAAAAADLERTLAARGAIMASMGGVVLRGIDEGATYRDYAFLSVIIPPTVRARYVLFKIDDGVQSLVMNHAPYRFSISRNRVGPGPHTVKVTVVEADGSDKRTAEIRFRFAEG